MPKKRLYLYQITGCCQQAAEIIPLEPDLFNYSVGNYVYII